ncbi:histidine kinase [Elizabethkingia anophelis]|nr:histidine kinase [Elizabethkingia anophelis]
MKKYLSIFIFSLFLFFLQCSQKKSTFKAEHNYAYDKATEYRDHLKSDSAFIYYLKAKEEFLRYGDMNGVAKSLINMSVIMCDKGDYFGSIEMSIEAKKALSIKNDSISKNLLASNFNTMAIASKELKNYDDAISYYQQAIKLTTDKNHILAYYNNIGDVFFKKNKNSIAVLYFKKALSTSDSIDYARALNNLAKTSKGKSSILNILQALKIRQRLNDYWGENSSYATLSNYYYDIDKNKSLIYATKMYGIAKTLRSPDDQIEALQKLIVLENPEKSKQYFLTYQKLNDSLQTARSKAKNQFALIRYETEKNKANFQKAQADNVKKQNQILKQYAGLGILGLILIGGGAGSVIWYRRRRKRLEKEKELEIKKTELRYSKKVHDKVANKVYRVMSEVENVPEMKKEVLLDKLENIYEISRDISYDHEPTDEKHLVEMLESYSSQDEVQLVKVGIQEIGWDTFNKDTQSEVFNVLQELMTNMKKHSKATRVVIIMSRINEEVTIRYTDNGVGCDKLSPKNGIKNTGNRMESIGGAINFDAVSGEGFKAELKFSVQ